MFRADPQPRSIMHRSLFAAALAAVIAAPALAQTPRPVPQGVDYRIEARLDESTDVLHGRARLRYTNNAGVALDTLYVQQYLNAFRPNSAWAVRELAFGERRFQTLGPEQHAFERFRAVTVDGAAVRPEYPFAPDSTVAALPLPAPLAPGATATVVMDWDARLSTTPRRQGRAGRHYDFAQWYPRIAVHEAGGWSYQPLLPQGEFWGEFGRYDVTLDVAEDQVIGATGVAVDGDPGYQVTDFELAFYEPRDEEALGFLDAAPAAGRKRVRWVADDVIHFAWSASPEFRHELVTRLEMRDDGDMRGLPTIHVLHRGDTTWIGTAARRTHAALTWTQGMFGPYPWPQLTNLHRLEPGGTEFPMLIMNGSASEGLIVHEVVHQYLHGILANNEWREGWLDEGFTSFMTNWYWEEQGNAEVWDRAMEMLEVWERQGLSEPIDIPSPEFRDFRSFQVMTYTKASVVFRMLREMLGEDVFRQVLRTYYERHKLGHVTRADFERAASDVSGRDLGWFFHQWLATTHTLDFAIRSARTRPTADGRWRTRVEVLRLGEGWMPVTLEVGDVRRTLDSRDRLQVAEVVTRQRPAEAVLDPDGVLLIVDRSTNRAPVR
jgi:hypothetical protein